IDRYAAAVLGWGGAGAASLLDRNGGADSVVKFDALAAWAHGRAQLGATGPGDARCALVRLAVLCAGLGLGRAPQPQYVHADCAGRGFGLSLQRGGDPCPVDIPSGLSDAKRS